MTKPAGERSAESPPLLDRATFETGALQVTEQQLKVLLACFAVLAVALNVPWALALARAPRDLVIAVTIAGFAGAAATGVVGMQRAGHRIRELGLCCPSCGEELVGGGRSEDSRHQRVLRTGRCPQCDTALFASVPGWRPQRDLRGLIYMAASLGVLLVGLAGSVWLGDQAERRASEERCMRWRAAATTSWEIARVAAMKPTRRSRWTCGELLAPTPISIPDSPLPPH